MFGRLQAIIILLFIFVLTGTSFANDPPHNEASGVSCSDCHGQILANGQGSPFWSDNKSDTAYNSICLSKCHTLDGIPPYNGTNGPPVKSHGHGGTFIKCTICHHNHDQDQIYVGKNNKTSFFLAMGSVNTGVAIPIDYNFDDNTTTITYLTMAATDGTSQWVDMQKLAQKSGDGRGALLVPNHTSRKRWPVFLIKSIDTGAKTITVKGRVTAASNLGIFYGQGMRSEITYTEVSETTKDIVFFDKYGSNGYVNPAAAKGICQVCHTRTGHWSDAAPEGDDHHIGEDCMGCHNHTKGFSHGGSNSCGDISCHGETGSHATHLNNGGMECAPCHKNDDVPFFKSGTDSNGNGKFELSETNVCDSCHSQKPSWGGSACLTCHDSSKGGRVAAVAHLNGDSHHIQGVALEDAHCFECHWEAESDGKINNSYHGGGKNAGAAVNLVIYGYGNRPAAYDSDGIDNNDTAVEFTANQLLVDESSSRQEIKKINGHCLGCHSDKNNDTQPFGDGKTPRQYAWDNSSIKTRYAQVGSTKWGKYTTMGTKKDQTKAYSAHGNAVLNQGGGDATTWVSTREGSVNVACFDCHNSHGSFTAGVTTSYTSGTANGGLLKNTSVNKGGYTMDYTPQAKSSDKGKYSFNSGAALCFDCHQNNYSGSAPWGFYETFGATKAILGDTDNMNFGPSDARITHSGGHFGVSFPLSTTPNKSINGLCVTCHDPHGISTTINQNYGVPLLKGTWMTSGYRMDDPPPTNYTEFHGYFIDQNTFYSTPTPYVIDENASLFGGLCMGCHEQADIDPDNASNVTWKSMDRVHDAVKGWGVNNQHNYSCSKCHTAHSSTKTPRLMISNCMDYRHKGRVGYNANPYLWGSSGSFPNMGSCHGANNGYVPSQSVKEQYWNNVTRWEDRDDDDSLVFPTKSGLVGEDCDDNDANIYRAIDGTCDGDGDLIIDASANGLDCDDNDNAVGHVPGICDKDGDGVIDWNVGGYDCDDNNPLVTVSANGFCE